MGVRNSLRKARVAVMTAIDLNRSALVSEVSQEAVEDIEGRWQKILSDAGGQENPCVARWNNRTVFAELLGGSI